MRRAAVALIRSTLSRLGQFSSGRGAPLSAVTQLALIVIGGLLIWRLADVLLLAFGAILVAVLLQALANPLAQHAGFPRPLALSVAVACVALAFAAGGWLFGQQITQQINALTLLLPRAWAAFEAQLSTLPLGGYLLFDLQHLRLADGMLVESVSRLARGSASAIAAAVIVCFCGLYVAFHPGTYLHGAVRLSPREARPRLTEVLLMCGEALNRWLLGQLASMLIVGVTVTLGLWLAGVPSPVALGGFAGLAQFVPVIGPIVATVPGLVLAGAEGGQTLTWAIVVYIAASQFEANVVTPLVLRQMVELPMGVTLFAVLAMGVLLGPLGVLFATPLAVVAYVIVRTVYLEDILADRGAPPGYSYD